ncbi:MAG: helix-turn-helix transcriptional regulator [Pleurocapsa sp. SU_196_0]|nr:helix-turn-helix transcriptional regulator [Pleurocapsa sp. SU_196_0]
MMLPRAAITHWNKLQDALGGVLRPVENSAHYDQLAALLDDLLETVRSDAKHPLRGLLEVVTQLVLEYDARHPLPLAAPAEMLEWHMRRVGVNQVQLAAATGLDQSLISKHLTGKRAINLGHAMSYVAFFDAPLETFVTHLRPSQVTGLSS